MLTAGSEVAFVNESEVDDVVCENSGDMPKISTVQLKRDRGITKGILTKKQNEIESLIDKFGSIAVVEIKLAELNSTLEGLEHIHALYHGTLSDHEDIQDSLDYFNYEELKVKDLILRVQKYQISLAKEQPEKPLTPIVKPLDSISNVGSKRSSVASSVSGARAKASDRKVKLLTEVNVLKKMQNLEQEELRLQQAKEELKIKTELAKAEAEERTLAETVKGSVMHDDKPLPLHLRHNLDEKE